MDSHELSFCLVSLINLKYKRGKFSDSLMIEISSAGKIIYTFISWLLSWEMFSVLLKKSLIY